MRKGQKTQKKLEFRLKNNENRQKAGLKSCFGALIGTKRDESAFLGRRAGRRVSVSKSGLSRRDRDGWQVWKLDLSSNTVSKKPSAAVIFAYFSHAPDLRQNAFTARAYACSWKMEDERPTEVQSVRIQMSHPEDGSVLSFSMRNDLPLECQSRLTPRKLACRVISLGT